MRNLLIATCLLLPTAALAQTSDRAAEIARLKREAEAKTRQIGELAQKGALTTSDEAVRLLQGMVDELKAIRESLRRLEGADPAAPVATRFRWQGYAQFQYQDTNRIGPDRTTVPFDGFRFRRFRVGFEADVAPRLIGRFSLDATGSDGTGVRARDAYFVYDLRGHDALWAGQFPFPLGYELERSSQEREMPERAQYNQILFTTERSRGLELRSQEGRWTLKGGVFDALTIGDPEGEAQQPGSGERVAVAAQARYAASKDAAFGVSALAGERPAYASGNATSPQVARRFLYADARVGGLLGGKLTLLGEAMLGSDRLPSSTANPEADANDLAGYHVVGLWRLSYVDRLAARWQAFDPNLDAAGDNLSGLGLAYIRDFSTNLRLTLGYESFDSEARRERYDQARFGQTFLRLQVRF